ncbi:MAG: hypothetical protein R3C16_09995 [Hyphomonadaceae bacterium]
MLATPTNLKLRIAARERLFLAMIVGLWAGSLILIAVGSLAQV